MTQIKKILDKQGNEVFLRTSTKAVVDENGYTAESRLQAMQDEINSAQMEIGAVPSDLTPTENSTNWVTSGGIYNSINTPQEIDLQEYLPVKKWILSTNKWAVDYYSIFVKIDAGRVYKIEGNTSTNIYYTFLTSGITGSNNSTVSTFASGYSSRLQINAGETVTVQAPIDATYLWLSHTGSEDGDRLPNKLEYMLTPHDLKDIHPIEEAINNNIELAYTKIDGKYVRYSNGNQYDSTVNSITNYIDIQGLPSLSYARIKATNTTSTTGMAFYDSSKAYISGQKCLIGESEQGYVTTSIAVPENAKYARFTILGKVDGFFVRDASYNPLDASEIYSEINKLQSPLKGKKVSIIGDSISCFGTESQTRTEGYNSPYWIVKTVDVGNEIQSWVTWLDVYSSVDSTSLINKTIGGVTITSSMIGTLQTFTPVAEDVGKAIGVPRWASSYTDKPWWQVLIDNTGAELCANASWSGSRIIKIPSGNSRYSAFRLSEAYSDYTIGRVATRDDNGNIITPDVIIIYRGTNDFSAEDPEGGASQGVNESLTTPDLMTFTEIVDERNFTECYIETILKLRETYPSAYIILCTLNIFKRRNASHYPPNNGTYTLVDYNNKIREIANIMGCGIIELDKDGITFENCYPTYISDSSTTPTHPNTNGHKVMGEKAAADIKYVFNKL